MHPPLLLNTDLNYLSDGSVARNDQHVNIFADFLQLSDEYANEYMLDISAEIKQQRNCLNKLKERIETAEKLRGEVDDLKTLWQSATVAIMVDLRATGNSASVSYPEAKC